MRKRQIDTEIGIPEGASRPTHIVVEAGRVSSFPEEQEGALFALTLRIGAARKFSFTYDVAASRKRRNNLIANGRIVFKSTDWE
ncbi:hypothetical protein [Methylobacterium sp. R2-1]|uniref:hypothetical protein n=1 Tax=Methylobacterium sp. R2-1 TaxID=2587064 RepID=UPI001612227E|nr:hypothetical protein [Methylobacterium sp. R2-1]MBB2960725.1 hypothetical protein [Methylobacterium sp. R2-1]